MYNDRNFTRYSFVWCTISCEREPSPFDPIKNRFFQILTNALRKLSLLSRKVAHTMQATQSPWYKATRSVTTPESDACLLRVISIPPVLQSVRFLWDSEILLVYINNRGKREVLQEEHVLPVNTAKRPDPAGARILTSQPGVSRTTHQLLEFPKTIAVCKNKIFSLPSFVNRLC